MGGTRIEQLWTIRIPNMFGIRAPTVHCKSLLDPYGKKWQRHRADLNTGHPNTSNILIQDLVSNIQVEERLCKLDLYSNSDLFTSPVFRCPSWWPVRCSDADVILIPNIEGYTLSLRKYKTSPIFRSLPLCKTSLLLKLTS